MVHYSSILLVLLLCVASSYATKVVDVDTICKQSPNPSFCSTLLNSKSGGAKGADLISLAHYTIDVVRANLTNSMKLIKTLIAKSGNDVNAREHYNKCLSYFVSDGGVLSLVEDLERLLKQGNYPGVALGAENIALEFALCTFDPDYKDNSSLIQKYLDVVTQVTLVIRVIAYGLID